MTLIDQIKDGQGKYLEETKAKCSQF